jgi:hypothetical protein
MAGPVLYSRVSVSDVDLFFNGIDDISIIPDCESKKDLLTHVTHITLGLPRRATYGYTSTIEPAVRQSEVRPDESRSSVVDVQDNLSPSFPNLEAITALTDIRIVGDHLIRHINATNEPFSTQLIRSLRPPSVCWRDVSTVVLAPWSPTTYFIFDHVDYIKRNYFHISPAGRIILCLGTTNFLFLPRVGQMHRKPSWDYLTVLLMIVHHIAVRSGKGETAWRIDVYGVDTDCLEWWDKDKTFEDLPRQWASTASTDMRARALHQSAEQIRHILHLHPWEDRPVCPGCGGEADKP